MKKVTINVPEGLDPDKLVKLRAVYDLTENDMNHMRYGVKDKEVFEGIAQGLVRDILKHSEKKVTENPDGSKTYELDIHLYNKNKK